MPNAVPDERNIASQSIGRIILAQLGVAAAAGALCLAVFDERTAASAMAGGVICAAAGAAMAWRALKVPKESDPRALLGGFVVGEALKIGVTVGGFFLAIRYLDVVWLALLLTYIAGLAVYWLALGLTSSAERALLARVAADMADAEEERRAEAEAEERAERKQELATSTGGGPLHGGGTD